MDDKFTFTLKSPISDEQWDKIMDVDFEHTDRIWFETKHGKVEFVKASAQPEITDEQAIDHLEATGWLKEHDRQMYEMGIKEQLKDDSESYDSLIPQDCIHRQDAIDVVCMDGCGLCREVIEQIGGGND